MKTASEIDRSLNQTLTILVSAIIHAGLMVGICCSATEQKEKPIAVATKLIELNTTPLPPSPKKETPPPKKKDEPPPPQKETPPPPPHKKETPPPKPVEQPKPVEVKPPVPTPAVVKTETPKPVEQPKKLTRAEAVRKHVEAAPTKQLDPQPQRPQPQQTSPPLRPQPVKTKSTEEYAKIGMAGVSTDTSVNLPKSKGAAEAKDSTDYAVNYAAPVLYENWNPSRAGMTSRNPSPVEISFMITIDGIVSNARIIKQSNDSVMTRSVADLVNRINSGLIKFTSLRDAGINRPFLQISVTMYLKD
ncbi:MAG: hypothetical protein IKS67_14330 [Victivallales bacterium]|nr:hypothetical protein [Victivallales bacterium]